MIIFIKIIIIKTLLLQNVIRLTQIPMLTLLHFEDISRHKYSVIYCYLIYVICYILV